MFLFELQHILKKFQIHQSEFAPHFFAFHYYLLLSEKSAHKIQVNSEKVISKKSASTNVLADFFGRDSRIRTYDIGVRVRGLTAWRYPYR